MRYQMVEKSVIMNTPFTYVEAPPSYTMRHNWITTFSQSDKDEYIMFLKEIVPEKAWYSPTYCKIEVYCHMGNLYETMRSLYRGELEIIADVSERIIREIGKVLKYTSLYCLYTGKCNSVFNIQSYDLIHYDVCSVIVDNNLCNTLGLLLTNLNLIFDKGHDISRVYTIIDYILAKFESTLTELATKC